jgi:hypothetical protein
MFDAIPTSATHDNKPAISAALRYQSRSVQEHIMAFHRVNAAYNPD